MNTRCNLDPQPHSAVLIVDDDVDLCGLMRELFDLHGYRLECAHDGVQGLARALEREYGVLLLDVMLPRMSGFDVLRELRRHSTVPVIMLTARSNIDDRVAGLNAGADDYIAKPFMPAELLARVGAVLRRSYDIGPVTREVIEANGVRLNTTTLEASHDGIPIVLTWVESEILGVLIRSAGRVVSRDELSALLNHRQATPFERSIDVHISRLRKKLGDPHLIATIRGDGYMFRTKPLRASSNAVQDASRGA